MKRMLLIFLFIGQLVQAQKLKIATYQYADNPRIKNLEPLAAWLEEKTGQPAEVKSYATVHLLIEAIQNGEIDLAFINTFGFLLLETTGKPYPMSPVLAMITPDSLKSNYRTAILGSAKSPTLNWNDLGKYSKQLSLALVFPASTSGNLVPRLGLTGIGINHAESSFREVKYAGTHANAIRQLLMDSCDLAAMGSAEYEKLADEQKKKLRLLWLSPEIPLGPALINTRLDKKLREQIMKELLVIHQSNAAAFGSLKSAWSESKSASQFIVITGNYYQPFLDRFGSRQVLRPILQQFAN